MNKFEQLYRIILNEGRYEDQSELLISIGDEDDIEILVDYDYYAGSNPIDDPHEININKVTRIDTKEDITDAIDLTNIENEIYNEIDFPDYRNSGLNRDY